MTPCTWSVPPATRHVRSVAIAAPASRGAAPNAVSGKSLVSEWLCSGLGVALGTPGAVSARGAALPRVLSQVFIHASLSYDLLLLSTANSEGER